jgi:hypothetical protein
MHASSRHHPGGGSGATGRRSARGVRSALSDDTQQAGRQAASRGGRRLPGGRRSVLVGALVTMAALGMIVASAYDQLATHNDNIGESIRTVAPAILSTHAGTAASPVASAAGGASSGAGATSSVAASAGGPGSASASDVQTQAQAQASADERRNTAVINSLARHHPPASTQGSAPLRGHRAAREPGNAIAPYGHH